MHWCSHWSPHLHTGAANTSMGSSWSVNVIRSILRADRNFQKFCINDRARCAKALTLVCPTESSIFKRWLMKVATFPFCNEWKIEPMSGYHCSTFTSQEGEVFKQKQKHHTLLVRNGVFVDEVHGPMRSLWLLAIFRLQNFSLLLGRWDVGCCNLRCSSPIPSISIHV